MTTLLVSFIRFRFASSFHLQADIRCFDPVFTQEPPVESVIEPTVGAGQLSRSPIVYCLQGCLPGRLRVVSRNSIC